MIIEKIFQVLSVVIMAIGILGLPAFFVLNARRKRIMKEFDENKNNDTNDIED